MKENELASKNSALRHALSGMKSILLAYSGGVDSTFLLKTAREVLGDNVLAVTVVSPTYPKREYKWACDMARRIGARHISIEIDHLKDPKFCKNSPDRCYHCKGILFRTLRTIADREVIDSIVDASNWDDCFDFRPGMTAANEAGVRSPLIESHLTKKEIRTLSQKMDLPTWDMPSMACLASRFPYGEALTLEKIDRVDRAEELLRGLGCTEVRVRCHDNMARIEVDAPHIHVLSEPTVRKNVVKELKSLGFIYVTIDLEGYRAGSINAVLGEEEKV